MTFKAIPESATGYGFIIGGLGAHSSRTIMLEELRLLFAGTSSGAAIEDYRQAVVDENVLRKRTEATRYKSFRYLREMYGLAPRIIVFRALRDLWYFNDEAQPVLALLGAVARDPSLRSTANVILSTGSGAEITSESLVSSAAGRLGSFISPATLAKIGRNAASSWTQSGHLRGRTHKIRVAALSYPTSVTYALFLGYLCGSRGEALFHTDWARLLDTPLDSLHEQAFLASQQGWLDYRHAGAVTEVGFSYLLRKDGGADE